MTGLPEAAVDIVAAADEAQFRDPVQARHCPGAVPGTGETVRRVRPPSGAPAVFPAPPVPTPACDKERPG